MAGRFEMSRITRKEQWPKEEDLKNMDPEKLEVLKISKIHWHTTGGSTVSIKVVTNDGLESPTVGSNSYIPN